MIGTGRGGGGQGYPGTGGLRGRPSDAPTVKMAPPTVTSSVKDGGLDKEIVRRYLRRRMAQFQYCYEKQLVAKPEIGGALTLTFTIDKNGDVIASDAARVLREGAGRRSGRERRAVRRARRE